MCCNTPRRGLTKLHYEGDERTRWKHCSQNGSPDLDQRFHTLNGVVRSFLTEIFYFLFIRMVWNLVKVLALALWTHTPKINHGHDSNKNEMVLQKIVTGQKWSHWKWLGSEFQLVDMFGTASKLNLTGSSLFETSTSDLEHNFLWVDFHAVLEWNIFWKIYI